jgi:hypothetical protein
VRWIGHLLQKPRASITKTTTTYYKNHEHLLQKPRQTYYKNHEHLLQKPRVLLQKHETYYKNHVGDRLKGVAAITKARNAREKRAKPQRWQLLQLGRVVIVKIASHI